MNFLEGLFSGGAPGASENVLERILLALLIAFITGQFNAWCYQLTHPGRVRSRGFTQSLILIAMMGAFIMTLVGTNVIYAFGLLGAFAIVRFRTVVRSARDSVYILLALICGMAAGWGMYAGAVLGSVVANAVAIYLYYTGFGATPAPPAETVIRFHVAQPAFDRSALERIFRTFCRQQAVISVDELPRMGNAGRGYQCVWRLELRDPGDAVPLISTLKDRLAVEAVKLTTEPAEPTDDD